MKEKPVIAIDCDDVVVDFIRPFLGFYKVLTGKDIDYYDVFTYNLWDVLKCTREESIDSVRQFYRSAGFDNLAPFNGALNAMQDINQVTRPVIVTSRYAEAIPKTRGWFHKTFPELDLPIEFAGEFQQPPISKLEVYNRLNMSYVVEDSQTYSMQSAESGLKVFLVLRPWNMLTPEHPNITPVASLEEVVSHLNPSSPF